LFAEDNLFSPLGVEVGDWVVDWDGYYIGYGGIHFNARDAASFGLLYLNDGKLGNKQIVPDDWVHESLLKYSTDINSSGVVSSRVGRYFHNIGYGYKWWSATAGGYYLNFAWGHGGQLIVLIDELDMIIVVTGNPFYGRHDTKSWKHEQANINLVGKFITLLLKK